MAGVNLPAQAADGPTITRNSVVCTPQIGGTYPLDGHFYYCGADSSKKAPMISAASSFFNAFPLIRSNLLAKNAEIYVFQNAETALKYKSYPAVPTAAALQTEFTKLNNVLGVTYATETPPKVHMFERKALTTYPQYDPIPIGTMQYVLAHEIGHAYDYTSGVFFSGTTSFNGWVVKDQDFMTLWASFPSAATLRNNWRAALDPLNATPAGVKWREIFADEVAKKAYDVTGVGIPPSSSETTQAIVPYFSCSRAVVHAKMLTGATPVKADYDALNTTSDPNVYARCIPAPQVYVPPGCTLVPQESEYAYQRPSALTSTGWYVYCGVQSDATYFRTRTGTDVQMLPSSATPAMRQRFQSLNYAIYVFQNDAQALALLGAAAVPDSAKNVGALGYHLGTKAGLATTPFIAMFEQVKTAAGPPATYYSYPFSNALNNYESGLGRQIGYAVDNIALLRLPGPGGSTSDEFKERIDGDIARFNLRDGCAASGPDTAMWGTLTNTICNTTTHVKKGMYVNMTNLAIVRGFSFAQLGSGAVALPPDYVNFFNEIPSEVDGHYSLIFAELVGNRAPGAEGNNFAALHIWLTTIYKCGELYVGGVYSSFIAPTATCPLPPQ